MNSKPYALSGRAPNFWLLPLIGVACGIASAFVYAWVNVYSPIAGYISLLFVGLLAGGAVLPLAYAGKALKIRSVLQMRIAGLAAGVAALYFAWAFFAWVMMRREDAADAPSVLQCIDNPAMVWRFANAVAEKGWYSIRGITPIGMVLWIFWTIEAAVVIAVGWLLAPSHIVGRAFCEDCNTWMVDEPTLMVPGTEYPLRNAVRTHGLAGITQIEPAERGTTRWLGVFRQRCPACKRAAVYQATDMRILKTDKGERTEQTPVVPMSWMAESEQREIERIEALVQTANAPQQSATAPPADAYAPPSTSGPTRASRRGIS